eukprot:TRINITY_DN1991_c0_g1_i21.p1 TRINITY_DN1991_c0_g1~~TRINITY_DN1991_c0_g1_i21.p1  ORF type:complete len:292 (-),score=80.77 TRINITY_DN1991_c0_g1_i21:805-1680(-)
MSSSTSLTKISGAELKQLFLEEYGGTLFQFYSIYNQTDPHVRKFKCSSSKNVGVLQPGDIQFPPPNPKLTSPQTPNTKPRKAVPQTPTNEELPSVVIPTLNNSNEQHMSPSISAKKRGRVEREKEAIEEEETTPKTTNVKKSKVSSVNNNNNNNNNHSPVNSDDTFIHKDSNRYRKGKAKEKAGEKITWESEEEVEIVENKEKNEEVNKWSSRKKTKFSKEEEDFLFKGVRKYGTQWAMILNDSQFSFHECRKAGDLKDKWRNMIRVDPSLKRQAFFGRDIETESESEWSV